MMIILEIKFILCYKIEIKKFRIKLYTLCIIIAKCITYIFSVYVINDIYAFKTDILIFFFFNCN